MATEKHKKGTDPVAKAHDQAEKDMLKDPELNDPNPTDNLDEGELARRDNSNEKAFDNLERKRQAERSDHRAPPAREQHPGKDKER